MVQIASAAAFRARLGPLVTAGAVLLLALALISTGAAPQRAPVLGPAADTLGGRLLVATAQLQDPRFVRTVVYLVRHDASGAMGLIVNRRVGEMPLATLMQTLGLDASGATGTIGVHYGGPVETGRGFVLHTPEYAGQGTLTTPGGLGMTFEPGILRAIVDGQGPRRTLFALGYAGWAPGQLENEIGRGDWITVPSEEALVFDEDYEKKWERATARQRINL
jgi:putative transcriptional regulator